MREKYIDEKVGVWFIFGEHPDGGVDITDGDKDIFTGIDYETAEKLCDLQDEFRNKLYSLLR